MTSPTSIDKTNNIANNHRSSGSVGEPREAGANIQCISLALSGTRARRRKGIFNPHFFLFLRALRAEKIPIPMHRMRSFAVRRGAL
jgi:hypothetical protein